MCCFEVYSYGKKRVNTNWKNNSRVVYNNIKQVKTYKNDVNDLFCPKFYSTILL